MAVADTEADPSSRRSGSARLYAAALVIGLFVAPPLIWLTGSALFGAYADGGLLALWGDFFGGLARGARSAWVVALAPCALLALLQGAAALARRLR
jgi:hypothetical protein